MTKKTEETVETAGDSAENINVENIDETEADLNNMLISILNSTDRNSASDAALFAQEKGLSCLDWSGADFERPLTVVSFLKKSYVHTLAVDSKTFKHFTQLHTFNLLVTQAKSLRVVDEPDVDLFEGAPEAFIENYERSCNALQSELLKRREAIVCRTKRAVL